MQLHLGYALASAKGGTSQGSLGTLASCTRAFARALYQLTTSLGYFGYGDPFRNPFAIVFKPRELPW